jgi:hypothetical protein
MTYAGFWHNLNTDNRRMVLRDEARVGSIHYLFPQGGGPRNAFASFADLAPHLRSRDIILFGGVLREQATTPVGIFDVTIIGTSNTPRQATDGGVPTGGGASWLAPTSPTALTPLLIVREQSWHFENIQFAPVAGAACVRFTGAETTALKSSSHSSVKNCYFSAGGADGFGVEIREQKRIKVEGCEFEGLGTAIKGAAEAGVANAQYLHILNNLFRQNTNDINLANSQYCLIKGNLFWSVGVADGTKRVYCQGGAGINRVIDNHFADATADVTIAKGYQGQVGDLWRNWVTDAVDPVIVLPA